MNTEQLFAGKALTGKIAVVTGAGQGNGQAIALGLARAGAIVVATDLAPESAANTAALIRSEGLSAHSWALDVANADQCQRIAAEVSKTVGDCDIIINNAGIIIREGINSERAVSNWHRVIDVNLSGCFHVAHAWLPALKQKKGCIINVGSIASFVGVADTLGYSPSKGGVKLLTQALARELAADGIRVNAIAPGVIETPMTAATRADPSRLEGFMKRIPAGRLGQPQDLIGPVLFLASDLSSYVNGVTLPVDGGFLAV